MPSPQNKRLLDDAQGGTVEVHVATAESLHLAQAQPREAGEEHHDELLIRSMRIPRSPRRTHTPSSPGERPVPEFDAEP